MACLHHKKVLDFVKCFHSSVKALLVGTYILIIPITSAWVDRFYNKILSSYLVTSVFVLKSILSDSCVATPVFLWVLFASCIFPHLLDSNLYTHLDLRASSLESTVKYFLILSGNVCLWIGLFTPVMFNISVDMIR